MLGDYVKLNPPPVCSPLLQQGIVALLVTDDEALLERVTDSGQESFGAGVVATVLPRGYGTTRILTELQQAWLLGFGNVCVVSPVCTTRCLSACEKLLGMPNTLSLCQCGVSGGVVARAGWSFEERHSVFLDLGIKLCCCNSRGNGSLLENCLNADRTNIGVYPIHLRGKDFGGLYDRMHTINKTMMPLDAFRIISSYPRVRRLIFDRQAW